MSQIPNTKAVAAKEIDEYECSGNGPRPPVPGKESRTTKMIETAASTSSSAAAAAAAAATAAAVAPFSVPHADDILADCARVAKWRDKLSNLLSDKKGVELFQKFVEDEAGPHGIYTIHLEFYFACEGLKQQTDQKTVRQIIGAIYRKYLRKAIPVPSELHSTIRKIIKNERESDANIYNDLQRVVEAKIDQTTYPKFFQSKFFYDYVEQVQKPTATLNSNYSIGSASIYGSGSNNNNNNNNNNNINNNSHYGGEMRSGWTTAINQSPCDSLGASCSNLQESLTINSVLPTLHEDTELTIHDDVSTKSLGGSSTKPKLTKDLLLATQKRRLEVRPAGAHGYNVSFTSSFNPVSRQDSERQSCSSASQTDSDTKSLVSSKDGQPYMHRKPSSSESIRKCYMNPMSEANKLVEPITRERLNSSKPFDPEVFAKKLNAKLEVLKEERDKEERLQNVLNDAQKDDESPVCAKSFASNANAGLSLSHQANHKAITTAILRKMSTLDDNDQDILDQHVSRVFSPLVSPGTASPRQPAVPMRLPPPLPHRAVDPMSEFASQAMRHSKSIPEHASCAGSIARKTEKSSAGSIYFDSGVSMNSVDYKSRDTKPLNRELHLQATRKLHEDESRRLQRNLIAQSISQMPTTSMGHHTNSLPRVRDQNSHTFAVYTFFDEKVPYRTKLPTANPTLKLFKECLHKKGNYRYFFKKPCEELTVVQEEFTNDADILPLFEGKVMGMVTPM